MPRNEFHYLQHARICVTRRSTWVLLIIILTSVWIITKVPEDHNSYMDFVTNTRRSDLENRLINKHEYTLLLNEEHACVSDTFLLILVHSAPENHEMRQTIRETYGTVKEYKDVSIRVIFLLGTFSVGSKRDQGENTSVRTESNIHHDIVMADFADHYDNLTYKSVMGLYWVNKYCKNASFILKADDDVIVNVYKLISFLLEVHASSSKTPSFLYCKVWQRMRVVRNISSKYFVSYKEYAYTFLPSYCDGPGYLLSSDVSESLYQASTFVPFFRFEDAFTGMCTKMAGVTLMNSYFGYYMDTQDSVKKFSWPWDWVILRQISRDRKQWYFLWNHYLSSPEQHSIIYYQCLKIGFIAVFVFLICIVLNLFIRCRAKKTFQVYQYF